MPRDRTNSENASDMARSPGFVVPLAFTLLFVLILFRPFIDYGWGLDRPTVAEPTSQYFQIPSQPLASALEAYARNSGIEVLYESSIVAALQSSSVDGTYTPDMALQILLSGTDLKIHYARQNAITLSLPREDVSLPPASPLKSADLSLDTLSVKGGPEQADAEHLREFSEAIQSDLAKALRDNARTRSGSYRVNVDLWVDATRKIRSATLLQSTGDATRDASIPSVLEGLTLSRAPPANTPQPVKVVITVRSL
jgi:hypothetical protein